jgi:methionyl aminopeptidase
MKKHADLKVWDIISLILKQLASHVRPGITTLTLNNLARDLIEEYDVASFNRGYHPQWAPEPYRYETCISVNDEIVHGIPSERVLQEGDLVNIDLGIIKGGQCADASLTVGVGQISDADAELLHYAKKSLYEGIKRVRAGVKVETIARAIEETAAYKKFVVNCTFTGHKIGKEVHEEPAIYHARNPYYDNPQLAEMYQKYLGVELQAGQIICLEPALTRGDRFGRPDENGWTWRTRNHQKSAIFEEMILVKDDSFEILTSHLKEEHEKYFTRK